MFNPEDFLSSTVSEAGETRRSIPPVGEYVAFVDGQEPTSSWIVPVAIGKGDRAGQTVPKLHIPIRLESEELKAKLGLPRIIVFLDRFLDVAEDGRGLDMGPNRNLLLNQLRAAVGQNTPGATWSIPMLANAGPFLVMISHRPNEKDAESPFVDIKGFAAIRR